SSAVTACSPPALQPASRQPLSNLRPPNVSSRQAWFSTSQSDQALHSSPPRGFWEERVRHPSLLVLALDHLTEVPSPAERAREDWVWGSRLWAEVELLVTSDWRASCRSICLRC